MTPKEKAIELFCKMYGCEINTDLNDIYLINGDGYFLAKDCALIAVEEMINNNKILKVLTQNIMHNTRYLQQVKQEIENL